ncbi:unnamed protein product [Paramecium pentaurelia]|uniref:Uncharacterized protein n=1 Tax=Paramecium pentaurelia TaxID=43138 RepID=A0A8S1UM68_9CILI|nr:unnamed protein product [Paramecium pentaurelia]
MNSKQLKFQIEVENPNKENECYQDGHRFNKQRISRIPLTDITDILYPKRTEMKSSPLKWVQLKFSSTIQLR